MNFGAFKFLCETTNLVSMLCYALKPIEYFCEMIDFMGDEIFQTIHKSMFPYPVIISGRKTLLSNGVA